jgi:DHA1 family bicyclomycin/chloramphenicol resistance-like MFS transporter
MNEGQAGTAAAPISYVEFVALIAFLMAMNSMAIDVILPALQEIGSSLGVADENARQLPLTAYVAAFGLSQLFYGPISDRFGRRPVLLFGLVVYTIGCVGAFLATSYPFFLAMRALQGIGAGAPRVIAISAVRDLYGGRKMASVMSLAMMVFMAVPIVAPAVGQGIMLLAGWRAILLAMGAFGIVTLTWCYFRLPETLAEERRRPLQPRALIEAFRIVLTTRIAFAYGLAAALAFAWLFSFLNSAQQVFQEIYGLGKLFPLAFAIAAALLMAAAFTNSRLVQRLGMRRLSHAALAGFTLISAVLCAAALLTDGHPPFWLFFGVTLAAFFQFGLLGTNFNALAMEPLGHVAGTASSVLGSLQTLLGGLIGALVGYAYDGTLFPLAISMLVLSLASFAIVAVAERGNLFGRRDY